MGTIWALFWSPWDLNNIENHPKTLQMLLQGSLTSQDVAPERSGRYFCLTSLLSGKDVLRFSALFWLLLCSSSSSRFVLVPFWFHFGSPLAFSLRRSSNSSFSLFSRQKPPWDTKITPKRSKCSAKASQMVHQRSPGALKSVPGEPHEPRKPPPREHLVDPWASKRSPGVVLGASGCPRG